MDTKIEVVQVEDLKWGDLATFYFEEDGVPMTETGIVELFNQKQKCCVLRTGKEEVRIMSSFSKIERTVVIKPKQPILAQAFSDMDTVNEFLDNNDVKLLNICAYRGAINSNIQHILYYKER